MEAAWTQRARTISDVQGASISVREGGAVGDRARAQQRTGGGESSGKRHRTDHGHRGTVAAALSKKKAHKQSSEQRLSQPLIALGPRSLNARRLRRRLAESCASVCVTWSRVETGVL